MSLSMSLPEQALFVQPGNAQKWLAFPLPFHGVTLIQKLRSLVIMHIDMFESSVT